MNESTGQQVIDLLQKADLSQPLYLLVNNELVPVTGVRYNGDDDTHWPQTKNGDMALGTAILETNHGYTHTSTRQAKSSSSE